MASKENLRIRARHREDVKRLMAAGKTKHEIAAELGMSRWSVGQFLSYGRTRPGPRPLAAPVAPDAPPRVRPARRKCLSCGRIFWSAWCGNRMFPSCEGLGYVPNID
jgi:hypothetical protein